MKISLYNNIVKNRRLLLERSARDIIRYSAGKQSAVSLFPARSSLGGDLPTQQTVKDLFASVFSSVEDPFTIKKIIEELAKINDVTDPDLYNNVFIIYDKNFLNEKFSASELNKTNLRSLSGGGGPGKDPVEIVDLKSYIGDKYISNSSFNNGNSGKYSPPSRFSNPHVAVFKIKDHSISILKQKEAAYAPFCATMIPAIEMSKCVPYLNVSIVDDDKNVNDLVSLGKFLVGKKAFPTDRFAKGLSTVEFTEKQDLALGTVQKIFDERSKAKAKQNISGMELFQSPQSLVNADINKFQTGIERVSDPFRPLMSIEGFSINDQLKPLEFISTTSGTLTLKLFDRSRLGEVSKLVGQNYLASYFLVIEFGWSHPDGSIISNNPFGQFLNSLKRRELFVTSDVNVTVNDDGTASIKLNITSLGEGAWKSNAMSQKYISVEDFNEYLLYFEKKIKDCSSNALKTSLKTNRIKASVKNDLKVNDLILKEKLEDIGFFNEFEAIMSLDAGREDSFDTITERVSLLLKEVREKVLQVDFSEENKEIRTEVDETEKRKSQFKSNVGLPLDKNVLTQADLAAIDALSSESLSVEKKEDIQKLYKKAEKIVEEAVQSSTRKCIEEIVSFLSEGDAELSRTITDGGSSEEVLQRELAKDKNDINTVLYRLSLGGIKWSDTLSKSFSYDNINVQFGQKEEDVIAIKRTSGGSLVNKYITLGKLLTYCYGLPSALAKKSHDETQLFFHPANQQAGAFFNISLGDVFISTEKYLNEVANYFYRNKTSTATCETHLSIIRNILLSKKYCLGYGISVMETIENDDELTDSAIKGLQQRYVTDMNNRLLKYYSETSSEEDAKQLLFRNINLKIREETLSYVDDDGLLRKIRRVHFYDNNADPYESSSFLLESLNNTSIKRVLNSTVISNSISSAYTNIKHKINKFTTKYFTEKVNLGIPESAIEAQALGYGVSREEVLNSSLDAIKTRDIAVNKFKTQKRITQKISNEIETIIKASVPTIEFGAENGFVQSISLSNTNGGLANRLNQIDFVTTLSNPQNTDESRNTSRLYLNPSTLNISMMGYPIVNIGQTFYVTAKTNTTLDNIYRVTSVTHSISEGNFLTSITLEATNQAIFKPVNITEKLIETGYLNLN